MFGKIIGVDKMKLVVAIVQDADSDNLIDKITKKNFRVTKVSSTGGFLKSGNSTILCGIEDQSLDELLKIIENNCKTREIIKTIQPMGIPGQALAALPVKVTVGGATVFVLEVEDFKRY